MMQIAVFRWDGGRLILSSVGSGTSIGNGLVLTNKHVVTLNTGSTADFLLLCPAHPTKSTRSVACSISAGVVAVHSDHDAALVRALDNKTFLPSVGVIRTEPQVGDYVRIEGFPIATDGFSNFGDTRTITELQRWLVEGGEPRAAGDRLTITRGKIFAKGSGSAGGVGPSRMYGTNAVVNYGNSGGAAFDRAGFFIGIPTYRNSDFQSYVLDVVQLLPWIQENVLTDPVVAVDVQKFVKNLRGKKTTPVREVRTPTRPVSQTRVTRSTRSSTIKSRLPERRTTTTRNWRSPYASRSRR